MVKVALDTDTNGTIQGWTDEKFAAVGASLTDVDQTELAGAVVGISKLVDGHITTDATEVAAMFAVKPTAEQQMIASLTLELAQLKAGGAS